MFCYNLYCQITIISGCYSENIAIVEDNDQYASVITEYINKYVSENNIELNIIRYNNADDFLKEYQTIYSYHLNTN